MPRRSCAKTGPRSAEYFSFTWMKSKRVGIIGLLQESNTFIEGKTTLHHFKEDLLLTGNAIQEKMKDAPHEVGGFFEGILEAEYEAVPIFLARAIPYGVIEATTFDYLVEQLLVELQKAGPLDAILAAPHGATVAENHPDADGYWLGEVRKVVGTELPIVATVDPHANLSQAMVEATNVIIAYETNPHLDQRATGRRAADLLARILRDEIRPVQAAAYPPMAINIQSQETSTEPLSGLYESAKGLNESNDTLSHSVILGFPYADVPEMGSAVLVVTDNEPQLAREIAGKLGETLWENRHRFEPNFVTPRDAVETAIVSGEFPVVLLDMGDNVGGGSPADGTTLLTELHRCGTSNSFVCICDPESTTTAIQAGPKAELELTIGAKNDTLHGPPFKARFRVLSLHDGKFSESEARHGGFTQFDQGPTAVVETLETHITVMLTTRRMPPFSLAQLTSCDLALNTFSIIVAKGVIAPLAAYRSIAKTFIYVDTPGVTRADMTKLSYSHRRKPMFPFEEGY